MERNGVLLDVKLLRRALARVRRQDAGDRESAHEQAGQPFNLNSPKQIQEILFDKTQAAGHQENAVGHAVDRRRRARAARARSSAAEADPRIPRPLEAQVDVHRQARGHDQPATGRVHTLYAQAVAVTGRLSSNDPNLQNIPIRTAEGRRIREAFIAPPGIADRLGRLFADRAAHHGAHLARREPAAGLRRRRGHPPRDRRGSLRHSAGRADRASSAATPRRSTSA